MVSRYFPKDLVLYVSKTGFISKDTWKEFFFPGGSIRWKNAFWVSLVERGYFLRHPNRRLQDVYLLNRANREVIEFMQGRCVRPPFLSQMNHDEILYRGILSLAKSGFIANWTTEAELKSFEQNSFKIESQGRGIKYSDAIFTFRGDTKDLRVALEMEITQKDRKRYIQITSAYSSMTSLDCVIFIVGTKAIREVIEACLKEVYFPVDSITVGFIEVSEWQTSACDSIVRSTSLVSPMRNLSQNLTSKRPT